MIHLGIDTSNYKTSIAAVDDSGLVLANISEYLDVPKGERGLRQSDAFFKHSNRHPELFEELKTKADIHDVASIGVSSRPRRVEGSYMPCFRAGCNLASVLSSAMEVPVFEFSHQEGHAAAIMESSGNSTDEEVLFMHLSGGTTEFLRCKEDENGYDMSIVGGTLDISFGQLLDRFGVALGMPFPAGMYIDRLAAAYKGSSACDVVPGVRINDAFFNLSGPETRLLEFASRTDSKEEVAAVSFELMDRIADILLMSSDFLCKEYDIKKVMMAGGVASSDTVRKLIAQKKTSSDFEIIFGDKELSGDNAVGISTLAARTFRR